MFYPKAIKQPKPRVNFAAENSPAMPLMMPSTVAPKDRIRERGYDPCERRGCEPGQDEGLAGADQEIQQRKR
jgi:hypothetical protein